MTIVIPNIWKEFFIRDENRQETRGNRKELRPLIERTLKYFHYFSHSRKCGEIHSVRWGTKK